MEVEEEGLVADPLTGRVTADSVVLDVVLRAGAIYQKIPMIQIPRTITIIQMTSFLLFIFMIRR